jgi:hypothetical protein
LISSLEFFMQSLDRFGGAYVPEILLTFSSSLPRNLSALVRRHSFHPSLPALLAQLHRSRALAGVWIVLRLASCSDINNRFGELVGVTRAFRAGHADLTSGGRRRW